MKTTINVDLNEDDKKERRKVMSKAKKDDSDRKVEVRKGLKKGGRDYMAADYVDEFLKICPTLESDIGHVLAGAEMVLLAVGGDDNIHPSRQQFVAAIFKDLLVRYYDLETKSMREKRVNGRSERKKEMEKVMSQVLDEIASKKAESDKDPMYS